MRILVINSGSSSIKAAVIDHETGRRLLRLSVERIGDKATATIDDDEVALGSNDHRGVLGELLPQVTERLDGAIEAVGHRVVHGGERFSAPTRIDDAVMGAIEELIPLAPLHNPANLAGITAARELLGDVPHVAVFDTAFHATLPTRAKRYAIDHALAEKHGVRRYGFHGTSHQYVAKRAARFLKTPLSDLRLITCHLGNGASVCAVEYGRSVETSMGLTPLEGLVMGTRSGDLDPGVIVHLMREAKLDVDGLDELLNKKSGLVGLSGVGNDMRDIEERASGTGDERCRLGACTSTLTACASTSAPTRRCSVASMPSSSPGGSARTAPSMRHRMWPSGSRCPRRAPR